MIFSNFISFIVIVYFLLGCQKENNTRILSHSIPETEGVSSEGILNFLQNVENSKIEMHSFMFIRHGKVIAETWWNPYSPELKHSMYSVTKGFTSTAIGFAVQEKLLNVEDKVISFFPEDLPDSISPNLSALNIKNLLCMASGHTTKDLALVAKESNWAKSYLSLPIAEKPGTKLLYNNYAPFMLSAIIQKLSGQKLNDYLIQRLFKPLGINNIDWEVTSEGIIHGGVGLRIKTEDMAKFGLLYLQNGKWNGKRILSKEWIREATSKSIDSHMPNDYPRIDCEQGYGYQFWRCQNNCFRADGAFGQLILVMPDQDAVIVITAETITSLQEELNLLWEYLLPAIHHGRLQQNQKLFTRLKEKLSSASLRPYPLQIGKTIITNRISGLTYSVAANINQIDSLSFLFKDNDCILTLKAGSLVFRLSYGAGKWNFGETPPYFLPYAKTRIANLPPFKVAGTYEWKNENTIELLLRYIESPHKVKMTFHFDNKTVQAKIENSRDRGTKNWILDATSAQ